MFYVFDFDGVLVDWVDECALTAYNAVTKQQFRKLDELPAGYLKSFRAYRCLAHSAWDIFYLASYLLEDPTIESGSVSGQHFHEYIQGLGLAAATAQAKFFQTREEFVSTDYKQWLGINRVYQPLWTKVLESLSNCSAIITNKNKRAVLDICQHFGWQIESSQIFAVEGGYSKIDRFRELAESVREDSYCVVEDSLSYLLKYQEIQDYKLRCVFAAWGYVSSEDCNLAKQKGLELATLEQFCNSLI